MLTNYHSHCTFCDGRADIEKFIEFAICREFNAYGISSHGPLPFRTRWNMNIEDVNDYILEIERMKKKYGNQLEIYAGMEIDYLDSDWNATNEFFRCLKLDYRIGSVHLLRHGEDVVDIDTSLDNFKNNYEVYYEGSLRRLVEAYAEASSRMIETGGFDIMGHPDKVRCNAERCQPGISAEKWYRDLIADLFQLVHEKGIMIEVNTKLKHRCDCFFPAESDFHYIKEFNIPIVINTDAHEPDLIDSGRREALEALRRNGISSVWNLYQNKWQESAI